MIFDKIVVVKKMDVETINVITLAYLGDAIYELYVRKYLIEKGIAKVDDLQKKAVRYVSSKSQSKIVNYLTVNNILTDREQEIIKRGRNYKRDSHPRNTDIITYKISTGFEALLGYLYLNNEITRIEEIINNIFGGYNEENN